MSDSKLTAGVPDPVSRWATPRVKATGDSVGSFNSDRLPEGSRGRIEPDAAAPRSSGDPYTPDIKPTSRRPQVATRATPEVDGSRQGSGKATRSTPAYKSTNPLR